MCALIPGIEHTLSRNFYIVRDWRLRELVEWLRRLVGMSVADILKFSGRDEHGSIVLSVISTLADVLNRS